MELRTNLLMISRARVRAHARESVRGKGALY
jgi:hypothetical protein